jgi:hypothetical protein
VARAWTYGDVVSSIGLEQSRREKSSSKGLSAASSRSETGSRGPIQTRASGNCWPTSSIGRAYGTDRASTEPGRVVAEASAEALQVLS